MGYLTVEDWWASSLGVQPEPVSGGPQEQAQAHRTQHILVFMARGYWQ